MQVLWSVLLTRLFSGLAVVFPSPLKTDDRFVYVWSVPMGVVVCTRVHMVCLEIEKCTYICRNTSSLP